PVPMRATALFVQRDIAPCSKMLARKSLRNNWPETNVGASAARDAPRGRRSISQALNMLRHAHGGFYLIPRTSPAKA
ncbi:hypothetical protein P3C22_20190, partial [Pseudomonas sp. ER28]|uniref:hypothetical protein n=1 Tax=Pseudomonas sp. ER28 TaxID=3033801 RepID=UPI0023DFE6F2